jgi:hypothetical protein
MAVQDLVMQKAARQMASDHHAKEVDCAQLLQDNSQGKFTSCSQCDEQSSWAHCWLIAVVGSSATS